MTSVRSRPSSDKRRSASDRRRQSLARRMSRRVGRTVDKVLQRSPLQDREKVQTQFNKNRTHTSKYTLLTFVPLNLFEQFRRVANFYFLCTLVLTMILKDSPISPVSWLLSLLFVVAVTMAKQGYEDYLRHKSDRAANERKVKVIRGGKVKQIQSQHVEVGEFVYLENGELVPCDLVVLSTSMDHNQCYVMTANLDGETNFKTRFAASLTKSYKSPEEMSTFSGYVECENPNPKLDNFLGRLTALSSNDRNEAEMCSLGNDNLLLAGTVLRNTEHVIGLCVYAGTETKMSLNSKITRTKFSTIEKSLNKYLVFFIFLLLFELFISTLLSMLLGIEYKAKVPWYLYNKERYDRNPKSIFVMFLIWLVLYNYIIPISMYVSLEIQKFLASKFIPWDLELYDHDRDILARCNTSDINEELGLVTHLFTDKTGTLTRNEMVFQKYSKDGGVFPKEHLAAEEWGKLLMVLTLCHSVDVSHDSYVASSPDEKALLDVCKEFGITFMGKTVDGEMRVKHGTSLMSFQKLTELEFDSFRKCMSVVVKESNGKIHLLTKGAEVSVLPMCQPGPVVVETERIVDQFAADGLRTLVLAYREITQEEYDAFEADLERAKQSLVNRTKFVREAYKQLESDLELIGATAIEDRLQDNVVETIAKMRRAGIITWMLTGDKKETALNLGHSSGLLESMSKIIDLCDIVDKDVNIILSQVVDEMRVKYYSRSASIVVDGKSVQSIMKAEDNTELFLEICNQCPTVIACRLSPIQKSQLVRMVKEANGNNLTAAIGDGGNDVSMIQEAHVGLGIIGLEGEAAGKAADFSFTRFDRLQRILFVHGHWFYRRLSFVVQYSFYKNVACFTCQLFFAIDSNWSGQTIFESMFLFLFNTIYTFLPVLIYGLLEQDKPADELLNNPELYKVHRHNVLMGRKQLSKWFLLGVWHSLVAYYGWKLLWSFYGGQNDDLYSFGSLVSLTSVIILNAKILVEAKHWNVALILSVILSIMSYFVITLLYYQFPINFLFHNGPVLRTFQRVIDELTTWMGLMLLTVIALMPDFVLQVTKKAWKPWFSRKWRCRRRTNKVHSVVL